MKETDLIWIDIPVPKDRIDNILRSAVRSGKLIPLGRTLTPEETTDTIRKVMVGLITHFFDKSNYMGEQ